MKCKFSARRRARLKIIICPRQKFQPPPPPLDIEWWPPKRDVVAEFIYIALNYFVEEEQLLYSSR